MGKVCGFCGRGLSFKVVPAKLTQHRFLNLSASQHSRIVEFLHSWPDQPYVNKQAAALMLNLKL